MSVAVTAVRVVVELLLLLLLVVAVWLALASLLPGRITVLRARETMTRAPACAILLVRSRPLRQRGVCKVVPGWFRGVALTSSCVFFRVCWGQSTTTTAAGG